MMLSSLVLRRPSTKRKRRVRSSTADASRDSDTIAAFVFGVATSDAHLAVHFDVYRLW
jgi:hypothetical protein